MLKMVQRIPRNLTSANRTDGDLMIAFFAKPS